MGETATAMDAIWTGLSGWITGIFGAIGDLLTSLTSSENAILMGFVILMPLMGVALGYLMKFLGKKKGGRRGR